MTDINELLSRFLREKDRALAEQLFNEIYSASAQDLRRIAFAYCYDRNRLDEVVNDTLLELWRKWIANSKSPIHAQDLTVGWLCTVAVNKARTVSRKKKNVFIPTDDQILDSSHEGRDGHSLRHGLDALMELKDELPKDDYALLVFSIAYSNRSQAARACGISEATFRNKWEKLEPILRKMLEQKGVVLSTVVSALAVISHSDSLCPPSVAHAESLPDDPDASPEPDDFSRPINLKMLFSALLLLLAAISAFVVFAPNNKFDPMSNDNIAVNPNTDAEIPLLRNMEFEKGLEYWDINIEPPQGNWDVHWIPEYGGACEMVLSGAPASADIAQKTLRTINVGDKIVVNYFISESIAGGIDLNIGGTHKGRHTRTAEKNIESKIIWFADRTYQIGSVFRLSSSVWPGTERSILKSIEYYSTDKVAQLPMQYQGISIGANHALALGSDGKVYAWGSNSNGELGLGDRVDRTTPTPIPELNFLNVTRVFAGDGFSFAILNDGNVSSWGSNQYGQLGVGDFEDRLEPKVFRVKTQTTFNIHIGNGFVIAQCDGSRAYGWGRNDLGQLGLGDTENRSSPEFLSGMPYVEDIRVGSDHCIMYNGSEGLCAFGRNEYGQLGLGHNDPVLIPTPIPALDGKGIASFAAGADHSLAITLDGNLYAWGKGTSGQLGVSSIESSNQPVLVTLVAGNPSRVYAFRDTSFCITDDCEVYGWGDGECGRLCGVDVPQSTEPIHLFSLSGLGVFRMYVESLSDSCCALTHDGKLLLWGDNSNGLLSTNKTEVQVFPIVMPIESDVEIMRYVR